MIKKIKINTEVIEMMLFFWQAVSEREKVAESFIIEVANRPEMKYIYNSEFTEDGARKVLSAISNSELLNGGSKDERRFWNNNMFIMEDSEMLNKMLAPVKTMNLDDVISKINGTKDYEEINLIFIPGAVEEYVIKDNTLVLNFFKIYVDVFGGTGEVTLDGKPVVERIIELLNEVVN